MSHSSKIKVWGGCDTSEGCIDESTPCPLPYLAAALSLRLTASSLYPSNLCFYDYIIITSSFLTDPPDSPRLSRFTGTAQNSWYTSMFLIPSTKFILTWKAIYFKVAETRRGCPWGAGLCQSKVVS